MCTLCILDACDWDGVYDLSGCLCVCGDWLGIHQKERSWLMGMNSIGYGGD